VYISRNGLHAPCCPVDLEEAVAELVALARQGEESSVMAKLKEIVPSYGVPQK
jgi:hypothetical protein